MSEPEGLAGLCGAIGMTSLMKIVKEKDDEEEALSEVIFCLTSFVATAQLLLGTMDKSILVEVTNTVINRCEKDDKKSNIPKDAKLLVAKAIKEAMLFAHAKVHKTPGNENRNNALLDMPTLCYRMSMMMLRGGRMDKDDLLKFRDIESDLHKNAVEILTNTLKDACILGKTPIAAYTVHARNGLLKAAKKLLEEKL